VLPVGGSFRVGNDFYDFGPAGAQFSGPVSITLPYDPSLGPDPYISFWDENADPPAWTALEPPFTIDEVNHTITGNTTHFTVFAPLAQVKPTPNSALSDLPLVTNFPETVASPETSPDSSAAAVSDTPVSNTGKEQAASNWGMIGGIAAGVLALLVVSVLIIRRRK
jgi:hypothetical protein